MLRSENLGGISYGYIQGNVFLTAELKQMHFAVYGEIILLKVWLYHGQSLWETCILLEGVSLLTS